MEYLEDGYEWIVDIDLEKIFDIANQDKLITTIGKTITDGDVVSLIIKYLSAEVMEKGIVQATTWVMVWEGKNTLSVILYLIIFMSC